MMDRVQYAGADAKKRSDLYRCVIDTTTYCVDCCDSSTSHFLVCLSALMARTLGIIFWANEGGLRNRSGMQVPVLDRGTMRCEHDIARSSDRRATATRFVCDRGVAGSCYDRVSRCLFLASGKFISGRATVIADRHRTTRPVQARVQIHRVHRSKRVRAAVWDTRQRLSCV
jgi:hypothetical protein